MKRTPSTHPQRDDALPTLRTWQADCIQQALRSLSPEFPHFLCQATPGAGKMLMAASLASKLMARGDIDYVLYLGPTIAVVEHATQTLESVTGQPMHGRLGAGGAGYTYHALNHRLEELKAMCQRARVLLIWDESHHAAGRNEQLETANRWGLGLLALERWVHFTLALSGTPWRTDGSLLPLLRYIGVNGDEGAEAVSDSEEVREGEPSSHRLRLAPDYVYTLGEGVRDGICRLPRLQLIDNRDIKLTAYHPRSGRRENHHYTSLPHLLKHPAVHYSSLLQHSAPLEHVLDLACQQLANLRQQHPHAAGLVVASDIAHAEQLMEQLEERGQEVCMVTSQSPGAHARLRSFRNANRPWIVAVGMVSEGVDIPRLRVCCYLSHIRTEQRFRQVLGRIIRRQGDHDRECFLYALNEPSLRRYARRISDDLPEDLAKVTLSASTPPTTPSPPNPQGVTPESTEAPPDVSVGSESPAASDNTPTALQLQLGESQATIHSPDPDLAFSQRFIARLVALQLPPT